MRIMSVELRGLDQAHDGGGTLTSAQGPGEEPVGSPKGHWPNSVFDMVVVNGQLAIIEVTDQRGPTSQAVVDGFPCRRAIRNLAALAGEPLPQGFSYRFCSLPSQLLPANGVPLKFARFAFDFVQRREVSQPLFGDVAAMIGVKIMEFPAGVSHAADLDHTAVEQRLVAGVVVADQLSGPASKELASMHTSAAVGKVVDDGLQLVVFARAVAPEVRPMGFSEARA